MNRLLTLRESQFFDRVRVRGPRAPFTGQAMPPGWAFLLTFGLVDLDAPIRLVFTYDSGAHASGWWRNSEYESCWHLSITARDADGEPTLPTQAEIRAWARVAFGEDTDKLWEEPPARRGDPYRPNGWAVTHLRLFVDQHRQPIVPKGEVYTLRPFADGSSPEKIFRSTGI